MIFPFEISGEAHAWADQILDQASLEHKIGQLIHVAGWSNRGEAHENEVRNLISKYHIGGIIFFQGTPEAQASLTNQYQSLSKIPLMISIDGEWGLGMRLEGAEPFPYQMTLGAVSDIALVREMGNVIARQMKRVGVTLNHAPVVDVNTNPDNPVINFRSFGQNKEAVTLRGWAYMKGMQEEGVLACAKHFPGHGDTSQDSHKELPLLDKSLAELKNTELYPFQELIAQGLGAMMVAHLQIPQLEPQQNLASTLSPKIVAKLLKEEMGFCGLILTDALDMKAVADHFEPGQADLKALLAGNDVLLFVNHVPSAVEAIMQAVADGVITEEEIDQRVRKQLLFKYWMGLSLFSPVELAGVREDVNAETEAINRRLYDASLTLLKKDDDFPSLSSRVALVSLYADGDKPDVGALNHHTLLKGALGEGQTPLFEMDLAQYYGESSFRISVKYDEIEQKSDDLLRQLQGYDEVIVALHDVKLKAPENFGITNEIIDLVGQLCDAHSIHLVFFGNPYALGKLRGLESAMSVTLAYQENKYTHDCAARMFKNQLIPQGKLPVDVNGMWPTGHGI